MNILVNALAIVGALCLTCTFLLVASLTIGHLVDKRAERRGSAAIKNLSTKHSPAEEAAVERARLML